MVAPTLKRHAWRAIVAFAATLLVVSGALVSVASATTTTDQLVFTPATLSALSDGTAPVMAPNGSKPGEVRIKVSLEDSKGNVLTNESGTGIMLTFMEQKPASGSSVAGKLTCGEPSKPTTVTSSTPGVGGVGGYLYQGVADFGDCSFDRSGMYTLTATASASATTITSATVSWFVTGPAELVITTPPGFGSSTAGTAGVAWSAQPVVTIYDAEGNVVTDDTSVVGLLTISAAGSSGTRLSCPDPTDSTVNNNPAVAVSGVATFSGCVIDRAGRYQIYAIDPTDKLMSAPSAQFAINAGPATHLAFSAEPTGASAGSALSHQPVASLEDAFGNLVSSGDLSSDDITLGISSGPSGGVVACDTNPVTMQSGTAAFSGCVIDKSGDYTLSATDSTSSSILAATSTTITITAGAANTITLASVPTSPAAGTAFATEPTATVTDAHGNLVTSTVSLAIESGPSGGTLTCDTNPVATKNGTATFSGCSIDTLGTYKLVAKAGALTSALVTVDVGVGAGAILSFATNPSDSTGGIAPTTQPVVKVTDAAGNTVKTATEVTLSLAPGMGTPGATLTCAKNPVTTSGGTATFSGCSVDEAGAGYRLVATLTNDSAVSVTSDAFSVTTGPPARLAFVSEPSGGTGGLAWSGQPVVAVEDAGGNIVTSDTSSIALTAKGGDGALACQDDALPAHIGLAEFSGCSIDKVGSYTLTATDNADGLSAVSARFAITTGPAAKLVFTKQPVSKVPNVQQPNVAFTPQPQVTIEDAGGNAVASSADITLSLTPGTGIAGAALACTAPVAATDGVATFSGCSIDTAGGGYTLTANGDGLSAETLAFSVVPSPTHPLGAAPTGVATTQTFGGHFYASNPTNTTDDVNTATGALSLSVSDLRVAGIGQSFILSRTYNSLDQTGGVFGPGWTSLLDLSVVEKTSGNTQEAIVRGADGQQLVFTWDTKSKSWAPPPGARVTLACTGKHCRVTQFDGTYWDVVLNNNSPSEVIDYLAPDHQGLRFQWSAGEVIVKIDSTNTTAYDVVAALNAGGEVTSVTTPAGRTVQYGYSNGHLTSVTDVRGGTWQYTYDTAGQLTGITDPAKATDPAGTKLLDVTYEDPKTTSRVASVEKMGSKQHANDTFTYATGGQNGTTVTTRHALETVAGTTARKDFTSTYEGNVLVEQQDPLGDTTQYSYDTNARLTEVENPLGWVEYLAYNAAGDLISQSNPLGPPLTMTYDAEHRITSRTDANGNVTSYTYAGAFLRSIVPPGSNANTAVQMTYNTLGELVTVAAPLGTKQFGYDAFGNQNLVLIDSPSGAPLNGSGTTTKYDEAGDRTSSTNPLGQTTKWTYDAAGNLLTTTTPGGQATTNTYNAAGDLASVVDAKGKTTTYSWHEATLTWETQSPAGTLTQVDDASGHLLTDTNAQNQTTTYVYDAAGRQLSSTDPANITTTNTYDAASNLVASHDSTGTVVTTQYDAQNHEIRSVDNGAVVLMGYDAVGNLVSETHPDDTTTTWTYNDHNKVASVTTDPKTSAAATTAYGYDAADNLTKVTAPDGSVTTYVYNGAGEKTSMTVAGSTWTYGYDAAGNLITTVDPDGRTTTVTLDVNGRSIKTDYSWAGHPTITVTRSYDNDGQLTQMTDATGTHIYAYDVSGDLTSASTPSGKFTYSYSTPGEIIETYPDGTKTTYHVDDAGNLMSLGSGTVGTANYVGVSYVLNAARKPTTIADANGVVTSQQYDAAGNLTNQTLGVGGVTIATDAYAYNASGAPTAQIDTVSGKTTTSAYGYDALGRVVGFSSRVTAAAPFPAPPTITPPGTTQTSTDTGIPPGTASTQTTQQAWPSTPSPSFAYDGSGNRLTATTASGTTTSTYNAADELVKTVTASGATTSYTYDKSGNLLTKTTASGTTTYAYNAAGELAEVTSTSGPTIAYTYDGNGNRATESVDGTTTDLVWDPASSTPHLVLEEQAGSPIRRYFYGDGPVAMQTATATYYYHLNAMGSVAELTGAGGAIVAAYHYDAFGNVTTVGKDAPTNPLLFQGQYLDAQTGLYDMGARSYDPTTGRFTQRDPVQHAPRAPAVSPYVFVGDQPTTLADPMGELSFLAVATMAFWNKPTFAANVVNVMKYGVNLVKLGMKLPSAASAAQKEVSSWIKYFSSEESSTTTTATDELAQSAGDVAQPTSEIAAAGDEAVVASDEAATPLFTEAGPASEALTGVTDGAESVGPLLGVFGLVLSVFVTVETCKYGTAWQCAGAVTGTVISAVFMVGCTAAGAGADVAICGFIGTFLSIGLSYTISNYGPTIAAASVSWYNDAASTMGPAFSNAFTGVTNIVNDAPQYASDAANTLATGLNDAVSGVSSGFDSMLSGLVSAGYTAKDIANLYLQTRSGQHAERVVNSLIGLGYTTSEIAVALSKSFDMDIDAAAKTLSETFARAPNDVADALVFAYGGTELGLAEALAGAGYAVDEVGAALEWVYGGATQAAQEAVVTALKDANYTVDQVVSVLKDVNKLSGTAVVSVLSGLSYGATDAASALKTLYNDTDAEAATALKAARYTVDEIAKALASAYDDTAQEAVTVLHDLSYNFNEIAGAISGAYTLSYDVAAEILSNLATLDKLSDAANVVAGALDSYFGATAQDVATALTDIGDTASTVAGALESAYSSSYSAIASYLLVAGDSVDTAASALQTGFNLGVNSVVAALADISSSPPSADAIGAAIGDVFNISAQDVAQALLTKFSASTVAGVLQNVFGESAQETTDILKAIGVTATDIASALASVYHQTTSDVESLLQAAGFSSSEIQAIGNDFSSFGSTVTTGLTSAWNTVTSWF